jgi:hypothetical protein
MVDCSLAFERATACSGGRGISVAQAVRGISFALLREFPQTDESSCSKLPE